MLEGGAYIFFLKEPLYYRCVCGAYRRNVIDGTKYNLKSPFSFSLQYFVADYYLCSYDDFSGDLLIEG